MTNKITDSLTQLYAQASGAQTPDAPPALSAAIMHAAAQAAAVKAAAPTKAAVQPSLAALFNKAASALQNIFAIPTIRYGLPAMMVAAVGFKIALPEAPKQLHAARTPVAAPMQDSAAPAAAKTAIAASGTVSTTQNSDKAAAPSGLTTPAIAERSEAKAAADSILADAPGKDAVLGINKNSGVADGMGKTLNPPVAVGFDLEKAAPQLFPTQQLTTASKPVGDLSRADGMPLPAKPAAAMLAPAASTVPVIPAPISVFNAPASSGVVMGGSSVSSTVTGAVSERGNDAAAKKALGSSKLKREAPLAMAAPAPSPAPAAAPVMAARTSIELSSDTPKDLRLRWLIASSRMVDGVTTETCNPQTPDWERVKSWISANANPYYRPANIPNAPSTLALAQRCGFSEAAAAMQASSLKQ